MKKSFAWILALALVMSMSVTAFAADQTNVGTGSYSADVTGTYVEGTTASGTVYSVDIAWAGMSFTYHAEKAPVWDVTDHTYSEATPAYWEGEGTITVTNHSNAVILAKSSYTAESGYADAEMQFDFSTSYGMYLDTAAAGNQATSNTITVTPAGTLPSTAKDTKIGTINLWISDANMDLTDESNRSSKSVHYDNWNHELSSGKYDAYDTTAAKAARDVASPLWSKVLAESSDADYVATTTALVNFFNEISKLEALVANAQ